MILILILIFFPFDRPLIEPMDIDTNTGNMDVMDLDVSARDLSDMDI